MRTGGLALNEAGNESGDRWSGEKKNRKGKKKGFINVIPSVGQVCRSAVPLSPSKGNPCAQLPFRKTVRLFPCWGKGRGAEKFKNEGRNEPTESRRGETHVKFYSIPLSPRERNPILLRDFSRTDK